MIDALTAICRHRKFSMVDVQNATLAGGVAVGSAADLMLEPFGAMLIGSFGGLVSVFGYVYVTVSDVSSSSYQLCSLLYVLATPLSSAVP